MDCRINSDKLSSSSSEIQNRLEDLKIRCISDLGNVEETLSNTHKQLQETFENLSSAEEELMLQSEKL